MNYLHETHILQTAMLILQSEATHREQAAVAQLVERQVVLEIQMRGRVHSQEVFTKLKWDLLESTESDKIKVRQFIMSCVDRDRLSSLDEVIGTISTIASASSGFLALFFEEFKPVFGVIAFVTILFFWIGYRVTKILHSVEYRFVVILSFLPYLLFAMISPALPLVAPNPYAESALRILPLFIPLLIIGIGTRKMWKWLTNSYFGNWSPWDSLVKDKAEGKMKYIVRFLANYWYAIAVWFYGFAAYLLTVISIGSPGYLSPSVYAVAFISLFMVIVAKWIIDSDMDQYVTRLRVKKQEMSI